MSAIKNSLDNIKIKIKTGVEMFLTSLIHISYIKKLCDKVISLNRENEIRKIFNDLDEGVELLVDGALPKDKDLFQTVLKTQATYIKNSIKLDMENVYKQIDHKTITNKKLSLALTYRVLKNLKPMFELIGVQPMTSPVNLVYTLSYKNVSENTMSFEVLSQVAEARTHRLQAGWSLEAQQDLNTMHGLDMEAELARALSLEVEHEIVADNITELLNLAVEESTLKLKNKKLTPEETLAIRINSASNSIAKNTLRGLGNWAVISTDMYEILKKSRAFSNEVEVGEHVLNYVGTLFERIRVYVYHSLTLKNTVLVGYKGTTGETDTGYCYCPYVMLIDTGVVIHPETFQPIVGYLTRSGKVFNRDREYAKNYYVKFDVK